MIPNLAPRPERVTKALEVVNKTLAQVSQHFQLDTITVMGLLEAARMDLHWKVFAASQPKDAPPATDNPKAN